MLWARACRHDRGGRQGLPTITCVSGRGDHRGIAAGGERSGDRVEFTVSNPQEPTLENVL